MAGTPNEEAREFARSLKAGQEVRLPELDVAVRLGRIDGATAIVFARKLLPHEYAPRAETVARRRKKNTNRR